MKRNLIEPYSIKRSAMKRIIKEILWDLKPDTKISTEAIECLHLNAEEYIIDLFEVSKKPEKTLKRLSGVDITDNPIVYIVDTDDDDDVDDFANSVVRSNEFCPFCSSSCSSISSSSSSCSS